MLYPGWVRHGRHEKVSAALLAGTLHPSAQDSRGFSLLHVAAQNGRTALVHLLLQSGADPHAVNAVQWTPLDYGASLHSALPDVYPPQNMILMCLQQLDSVTTP